MQTPNRGVIAEWDGAVLRVTRAMRIGPASTRLGAVSG
jgi:hypothetical protein